MALMFEQIIELRQMVTKERHKELKKVDARMDSIENTLHGIVGILEGIAEKGLQKEVIIKNVTEIKDQEQKYLDSSNSFIPDIDVKGMSIKSSEVSTTTSSGDVSDAINALDSKNNIQPKVKEIKVEKIEVPKEVKETVVTIEREIPDLNSMTTNADDLGICAYGCGTPGKYKLKNGKSCCSPKHLFCEGWKNNRKKVTK